MEGVEIKSDPLHFSEDELIGVVETAIGIAEVDYAYIKGQPSAGADVVTIQFVDRVPGSGTLKDRVCDVLEVQPMEVEIQALMGGMRSVVVKPR